MICIIPARFSSTRLKGKLLIPIQNKPLIQWTIENAIKMNLFSKVIVATDHEEIASIARKCNAIPIMTSESCSNGTERIHEAMETRPDLFDDSLIFNLQGDHPFVAKETILAIAKLFKKDPTLLMGTAVFPMEGEKNFKNPNYVKCVFDKDQNAIYFSRSPIPHQKETCHFHYHIGIYAYTQSFLKTYKKMPQTPLQKLEDLEQLKVIENGYKLKVAIVEDLPLGVDVEEDLNKIEKYLCP
ncbi:MAG TPA: 3-deoxy-manno-octulosonate cytidylyltransferase [Chlamydiales bacterium]|nr:3-deoxy-manno-octulosonate cytidylyltransferase [Chlamydiales bacterium]